MLSAMLLLACLPSSFQLNRLGRIDIEVSGGDDRAPAPALHFTARSHAGQTINECGIRIWRESSGSDNPSKDHVYVLQVYPPDGERAAAEYALVTE